MLKSCELSGFTDEIDDDIKKQIDVIKKLGQNYIEFRSANGKGIADYTTDEVKMTSKLLEEEGIKVSAVGSPIGKINITAPFDEHYETFKHIVEIAHIFGTKYIRMFSFFIPEGQYSRYKDEVFSRINKLVNYAKSQDVILLHENEKDIYGDKACRCLELMEEFFGDHFKCTFDFANFVQCKQDTLEAFNMLKPYIYYVHIKDALLDSGEVVLPGRGDGKVKQILKELDRSGYSGFLSLEPHLANFTRLSSLEKYKSNKKMTNREEAYRFAFMELIELLN